jgi:hypothetical protein
MPGQRVFTPRYRLFIPSSTNLPPAVMLRFDRPLERSVGPERRRAAVSHLQRVQGVSEQFACCVTGQHRATQRHEPVTATPHDPDATLRSRLRHFGPRITTPAQKAGQSITRKCNAYGANKGFKCHSGAGTMVAMAAP